MGYEFNQIVPLNKGAWLYGIIFFIILFTKSFASLY